MQWRVHRTFPSSISQRGEHKKKDLIDVEHVIEVAGQNEIESVPYEAIQLNISIQRSSKMKEGDVQHTQGAGDARHQGDRCPDKFYGCTLRRIEEVHR
jgi:hypothetical protein